MKRNPQFRLNMLTAFIISVFIAVPAQARADDSENAAGIVTFDPIFLSPGAAKKADLKRFEKGAAAMPGTYTAAIFINDMGLGNESVTFKEDEHGQVNLCLLPSTLRKMNFNVKELPSESLRKIQQESDECLVLKSLIPDVTIDYDSGAQRLNLSIPQAYLHNVNNGYVSPEYWDEGVNALMLGYQSNY